MLPNYQYPMPQVVKMAGAATIFTSFPSGPGLGQDNSSYVARAQAATAKYDELLGRISNIGNEAARNELLSWISRSDVPGTPAERRKTVGEDLANPGVGVDTQIKRVGDLEEMNKALEAKVKAAELAYASVQNPKEGQVKENGMFTTTGIVLGAVSLLGLLVVPLMVSGDK